MNRADIRRQARNNKKTAVYTRSYTDAELNDILGKVHKEAYAKAFDDAFTLAYQKAVQDSMMLTLAIPCNILADERYWQKTAKKKIPVFLQQCMDLVECYRKNQVTYDDMKSHLDEYIDYDAFMKKLFPEDAK